MRKGKKSVEDFSTVLRAMRVGDLPSIHRTYDSLSQESKYFIPSRILGSTAKKGWYWRFGQAALILSCNAFLRESLRLIHPKASFVWLIAENKQGEVIGSGYLRGITRSSKGGSLYLGIWVKQDYQGKEIGSKLMKDLIIQAQKKKVKKIFLNVHNENVKAISLYEKFAFKSLSCDSSGILMCLELD